MWPFILRFEGFSLPTYIVLNSLVFSLGVVWAAIRAKRLGFDVNQILDISLACMIGAFLGARLFHVFFEQPHYYIEHPAMVFQFWYGGFVFYGGLIGALVGGWLI